ncbi:MAG: glycosyltransferase family 2 protein [Micromonosporaceae bacterium]
MRTTRDFWPSVGVVIPTHHRPETLRRTLDSVQRQDYPGRLRTIVVYDGGRPDFLLARAGSHPVMVLGNARTPGLAGTRNTGIRALDTDLVAFCDDDDEWAPQKLREQVSALRAEPGAEFCSCAIEVVYADRVNPRLAGQSRVGLADLIRSRMAMLHSSTFVMWRDALIDGIGLVAEDAPGSQNEDWDLLLRAARRHPIVHVDLPLVRIHWGRGSRFAHAYDTKIASLEWMLDRHPEIGDSDQGAARVYGQLACWHAAKGERRAATVWARKAMRARWREPRAAIALAAAAGVVKVETVVSALHRRGHGI